MTIFVSYYAFDKKRNIHYGNVVISNVDRMNCEEDIRTVEATIVKHNEDKGITNVVIINWKVLEAL